MAKQISKVRHRAKAPRQRETARVRVTVRVPNLRVGTVTLRRKRPLVPPVPRLLGPPRSGFAFTAKERALILRAAPSMPRVDDHGIPLVKVMFAYLVEDHIARIKERTHRDNFKAVSRELGAVVRPNKNKRPALASFSSTVAHLIAGQLLLRARRPRLRRKAVDSMVQRIRAGKIPQAKLQSAARGARCLGALSRQHSWVPGTTTNEPMWILASHVLNEWRFGMKREIILSRDASRNTGKHEGVHSEGVHSELVLLTHALHEIAVRRVWRDKKFKKLTAHDPLVIMEPAEVYYTLVRVRRAMNANDTDGTGRGFSALRRPSTTSAKTLTRARANLRWLCSDVLRALESLALDQLGEIARAPTVHQGEVPACAVESMIAPEALQCWWRLRVY